MREPLTDSQHTVHEWQGKPIHHPEGPWWWCRTHAKIHRGDLPEGCEAVGPYTTMLLALDGDESWLIDLPYACFWIELRDGVVTKAPPIASFMARDHWPLRRVERYVADKGGAMRRE